MFGYQVCVADALYMLLGVTPANEGAEVRCMLQMWREKKLTLGSSIVAEMNYMSNNVWTPSGLCEATKLIEILGPIKRVGYVRDPANVPLALLRKQTDSLSVGPIYAFNEPMPQIACPILISKKRSRPLLPQRLHISSVGWRTLTMLQAKGQVLMTNPLTLRRLSMSKVTFSALQPRMIHPHR